MALQSWDSLILSLKRGHRVFLCICSIFSIWSAEEIRVAKRTIISGSMTWLPRSTGRKLNVHETFNLCPVPMGCRWYSWYKGLQWYNPQVHGTIIKKEIFILWDYYIILPITKENHLLCNFPTSCILIEINSRSSTPKVWN